jgi:hypothetical protein
VKGDQDDKDRDDPGEGTDPGSGQERSAPRLHFLPPLRFPGCFSDNTSPFLCIQGFVRDKRNILVDFQSESNLLDNGEKAGTFTEPETNIKGAYHGKGIHFPTPRL